MVSSDPCSAKPKGSQIFPNSIVLGEDKISSRDMHVLSGSTGAAGAGGASSAAGNEGGDELHDD